MGNPKRTWVQKNDFTEKAEKVNWIENENQRTVLVFSCNIYNVDNIPFRGQTSRLRHKNSLADEAA